MKLSIAVLIEKYHRYMFDSIYVQSRKNTFYVLCCVKLYDLLFYLYPDFRKDLYNTKTKYQRYRY